VDRFNLCGLVRFTVTHFLNRRPDGEISGRISMVGTAHPKGSRDVELDIGLDQLVALPGVLTKATPLTVKLICTGDGCSETTPVTRTGIQWESTVARLVIHDQRGAAPDYITRGDLKLEISANAAGVPAQPDQVVLAGYLCDKASYLEKRLY
jgi:hypothetical protein